MNPRPRTGELTAKERRAALDRLLLFILNLETFLVALANATLGWQGFAFLAIVLPVTFFLPLVFGYIRPNITQGKNRDRILGWYLLIGTTIMLASIYTVWGLPFVRLRAIVSLSNTILDASLLLTTFQALILVCSQSIFLPLLFDKLARHDWFAPTESDKVFLRKVTKGRHAVVMLTFSVALIAVIVSNPSSFLIIASLPGWGAIFLVVPVIGMGGFANWLANLYARDENTKEWILAITWLASLLVTLGSLVVSISLIVNVGLGI